MAGFPEEFRQADADQMKRIERELVNVLVKYNDNTHPGIVALVAQRLARTLLRKCSKAVQTQLRPVLVAFLEGKTAPPQTKGGIILPPEFLQ